MTPYYSDDYATIYLGDSLEVLPYYRRKWGGDKGDETLDRPFGTHPIDYWPPA